MATNEALFAAEDERMTREARGQAAPLSNAALFAAEDARVAEPALRANVAAAAGSNADQFAAQRKAAQAAGVPKTLGPAMPEDTARWASVETVARDTAETPTLRHRYTDEDFARLAHDDSGPLSQIERAVGHAVRYVMGAAPGGGLPADAVSFARAAASGLPNFGAGAYGAAAAPLGMLGLRDAEAALLGLSRDASATAKAWMGAQPDDASLLRRGVMSGAQSMGQNLALLPLGIAGSAIAMLGAMGVSTGGLSYLKGRDRGLAPWGAAAFGAEDAVAEVVTERYFGAAGLLKLIKAGSSAGKMFAYEVLREVPGEIGATLWQNFNEWQNLNPDKSVREFIAEQPEAVAETIIATLVGGGGQIAVVKGLERALGVTEQRRAEALLAEQRAAAMGELVKLAEASKLRERSPEDFQAFAQDVTANAVPALYFDAQALLRAGVDFTALARTMPSVAPQAEQALATGGDIVIPSGEFLAAAPGQESLDALVGNARTAPKAMSAAEAKEWMAERGDALKAQIDKVVSERSADADFMAGMQAVQAKVAEQLDAEPRFTKDANQRFAQLTASYYATMAERMGTTAEKLWEKYPLAVTSKAVGDEALAQADKPSLESVRKAWDAAGISHSISEGNGAISLDRIVVPENSRKTGVGTEAMRALIAYADATGQRVELSPSTEFGASSRARLVKFYKRFGFIENKGSAKDFSTMAAMVREPQRPGGRGTLERQPVAPQAGAPQNTPYETDLFGNPLPEDTRRTRRQSRPDRAGVRGDVQPEPAVPADTQAPPGDYYAPTVVGVVTQRKLGADRVTSPQEAAQATRYLYDSAVERLDGIVTDKDGKPLAVVGGFKGALSQASVYPATLMGEAVRIPGAAHIWFSHNHPSGTAHLSRADEFLNSTLAEVFRGSGIEPEGMLAIGDGQFGYAAPNDIAMPPIDIPSESSSIAVPVIERQATRQSVKTPALSSPADAKNAADIYYKAANNEPGILLLNAQHRVAAWVPLPPGMKGLLRGTGGLNAIYRAVSEANAGAAILVHGGELDAPLTTGANGVTIGENIGAALSKLDVRVLDSINAKTGASAAERGGSLAAGPVFQGESGARRGSFDPATNTIALLKDADLSTFLHESGHLFLTLHANLAEQIQAEKSAFGSVSASEQQVLDDMNTLLAWFGVQPSEPGRTALDEWQSMTLDQQREHHEKFARGFEAYLFTGKAPSMQLESLFQRFRAWLTSIYKQIKALGVDLTPEVRGVMDRMLATDEQIRDAEAAASMGMIFAAPEEAAKFGVDWATYHALGEGATQDAITALGARSLKDMQWLERAKGRELRKLQKQAAALRREAKMDARARVMAEPVYRAWAFLTGNGEAQDRAELPDQPAPEADSLFKAIALLGGLNRESATRDLGVHQDDYRASSGVFGKPVFRKDGGMSADAMAEALAEAGYLALDENGRHDLAELEEKIAAELGGKLQYPIGHDYGQAPLPALPEHATFGKLSTEALRERFGTGDDALWRKLSALGMTSDTVGIDPDVVGEAFGFDSGNALVRAIASAPPPAEAIEAATDRLMLERHGDITSPEALERAAQAAIHNEARARFVAAELDALQAATEAKRDAGTTRAGRTRRVAILPEAARRFAAETIARLKLRELLPSRYEAAAARAGRAADKALRKDDIARAAMDKRNQVINIHAAKAAHEAQAEVDRALRYFKRLDSNASRKRLGADYADQIDALLAQYDLRQRSNKSIDAQMAFAAWVQAQQDKGIELDIDSQGLSAKPYKEMTVEELRGLVDAVRQIEHLGRTKGRLLLAKERREYEAVRDAMVASIAANAHGREATARSATTNLGRAWEKVKAFGAAHIKAAQWARIMDGGQDGGAVWEGLIRPANEQADLETEMRADATERLSEILQPVRKHGRMGGKGSFFESIGRSLNREAVLVMALNMGNEGNMQRLLGGEGWTVQQVQPVLATLTSADWRAVQQVWDFMESYRPQIAALERRVLGREPKWVEPRPLTVTGSDGETVNLRGGYYPIVYDPKASIRAEENADAEGAKAALRGAHGTATTRRSFTKQRVESVTGRPLMYTLQGLYGGVNDVIHDLAWREWLIDTNRLLRSDKLDGAIRGTYGPEVVRQFKSWRDDIAIGDRTAQGAIDAAANWLRQSVSIAGLGFNVMSAALQPLGITASISRIGARWVGVGLKQYMAAPLRMTREVSQRSSFMENRQRTRFRELNELRNQIQGGPAANLKEDAGKYAYWLMMRAQQMVDVPTWLGAYEKAVAAGNDEARAVQLADQAVIDAQGAGHMHSQSAIERGPALQRLFTVFYSFMNTTLNMLVMKGMTNHSAARTAVDFLLLAAAPAVLASLLRDALTPGDAGDDDDWQAMAKKWAGEQLTFLFGLVVLGREFAEAGRTMAGLAEQPRDYAGPAGLRPVSDAYRLAQQANQGEFDDAMRKALVNVAGSWFGLPAAQINRTITGAKALSEGDTRNPAALVFGYQEPR